MAEQRGVEAALFYLNTPCVGFPLGDTVSGRGGQLGKALYEWLLQGSGAA